MTGDRIIYCQVFSKMHKVNEPASSPLLANFVIQWRCMDWSGFRNLAGCVRQFSEIENRYDALDGDFRVVERG